jgi:hypothetical protein
LYVFFGLFSFLLLIGMIQRRLPGLLDMKASRPISSISDSGKSTNGQRNL